MFKKIVVREGVVTEVGLYEPFKSFISDKDLECLTKEIKPSIRQKNQECAYARSDDRWFRSHRTVLSFLKHIYEDDLNKLYTYVPKG